MKKIKLEIDNKIFNELTTQIMLKKVMGNLFGIEDEVITLIMKAIIDKKKVITIIPKKTKKRGK